MRPPPRPAPALADVAVVALDPGRNLGVAYVRRDGGLEHALITDLGALGALELPPGAALVVGDGTGSAAVQEALRRRDAAFEVVDERHTTLAARRLYFRDHPPRGLARLLPEGLRSPPRPVDDYAAYAIALRWLGLEELEPPPVPGRR